jgi:hypothetical protein
MSEASTILGLRADSFLEYAFLRWVLVPAARDSIVECITPQGEVEVSGHRYKVDYEFVGASSRFAVELDGFEHHGTRFAFNYDRLRQNDLHATGRLTIRFSSWVRMSARCSSTRATSIPYLR